MPYISKFTASDGVTYDLKDSEARDYKIGKTADHSISGAAGWYKFFERKASSASASRKHIFLIQEVYSWNRSAILSFYSYRNSSGNWATSSRFSLMSSSVYLKNDFAMYYSGDTISLYVKKYTDSSHPLAITLISSMSGSSEVYIDPSEFWKSEAVTEPPSESIYAIPCTDGAGNVIPDTYATKIAVDAKVNDSVIASVEPTSTASEYHYASEVFMFNGNLYRATDNIGVGETIVPGTNAQLMTVAQYTDFVGEMLWEDVGWSYVPNTRTVNGKALSANITLDANDVQAITRKFDYRISGAAGWYKYFTMSLPNANTSQRFVFLINETYSSSRTAIISAYVNSAATGGLNNVSAGLIASRAYSNTDFAYYRDDTTNTVSFYCNKVSNTNGYVTIQVLQYTNRSGSWYDPTEYFETTSVVELPSGAVYFKSLQDGAGNYIADTYALKPHYGSITFSLSWSGSGPYTQTVTITGATVTSNSSISLQPTAAQLAQLISDGVQAITIENNAGTLTAYALGATPSTAMTIACTVIEVAS